MNKVIREGVQTKVLMLSATPVNNRFNDLKNQLQLAYEGDSSKINDKLNTKNSIDDIFRNAQAAYNSALAQAQSALGGQWKTNIYRKCRLITTGIEQVSLVPIII